MNSTPNIARVIVFCLLELLYFFFLRIYVFSGNRVLWKRWPKMIVYADNTINNQCIYCFKLLCYVPGANIVLFWFAGISLAGYRAAVKGERELHFLCFDCCNDIPRLEPEDVEVSCLFLSCSLSLSLSLSLSEPRNRKVAIIFRRKARRQIRLCICTVSPEPSQFAHISCRSWRTQLKNLF